MAERNVILMDMDGTLIKTKSGRLFPKDGNDWKLNKPVIKAIFEHRKTLTNPLMIIVTNQQGIEKGHTTQEEIDNKIEDIVKELPFRVDYSIIAPTKTSEYRKPEVKGINKFFKENNITLSKDSCMYGDAGGRKNTAGKKLDFSDSDLKFAENLGIIFIHANDCRN